MRAELVRAPEGGGDAPRISPGGACPSCGYNIGHNAPIVRDGLAIDPLQRTVIWKGAPVDLLRAEFDVLLTLVRGGGRVIPHAALMESAGYDGDAPANNASVRVRHLRQAMDGVPIINMFGVGYAWRPR